MGVSAKTDSFVLRSYVSRTDSAKRTPLDSVYVSISSLTDTVDVPFKLLEGDNDNRMLTDRGELRALVTAPVGKYMLTFTRDGFEPEIKEFERKFRDQTTVWVGAVTMQPQRHHMLNEVNVVETAVKVVLHGDTLVYNASAFVTADGSMLDALVRQLPGAELDANGQIKVNGRPIGSLLLNGKDFFKGDPTVMLENLPAYTVKNIKVYDKAGDDDYLSQASQKLDRREEDENLVMDVVLKKEYNRNWMANVEAGYGWPGKWLGKGFGLGFTDKFRLTAYANANNLRDLGGADTQGNWRDTSDHVYVDMGDYSGNMTTESGGLDYLFDSKGKWEAAGNVKVRHKTTDSYSTNASTRYFPENTLYKRSHYTSTRRSLGLSSDHEVKYKGKDIFLYVRPSVEWSEGRLSSASRAATFNARPDDATPTAALDSVFAPTPSQRFIRNLLTTLRNDNVLSDNNASVTLQSHMVLRTPSMPGDFTASLSGTWRREQNNERKLYCQRFGPANTSTDSPIEQDRYNTTPNHSWRANPNVVYTHKWSNINEKWSDNIALKVSANYSFNYSNSKKEYFCAQLESVADIPMPLLLQMPAGAVLMADNSSSTVSRSDRLEAGVTVGYRRETVDRSPMGLNPTYSINLTLENVYHSNSLDYANAAGYTQKVSKHLDYFAPNLNVWFGSSNDKRNVTVSLNLNMRSQQPSLTNYINVVSTVNPLYIYRPIDEKIKNETDYMAHISIGRYGRGKHRETTNFYANVTLRDNTLASKQVYNPNTGVTVSTPVNARNNYSIYSALMQSVGLGKRQQITLNGNVNGYASRYTQYITDMTGAEPAMSRALTVGCGANINGTYTFKNGSVFTLGIASDWNIMDGTINSSYRVHTVNFGPDSRLMAILPWQMKLNADYTARFRRGYLTDEAMRPRHLFNVSLSKSILKGKLSFILKGCDLFNSDNGFSVSANPEGYNESWHNTLGRYVLFTVAWKFSKGKAL